MSRFEERSTERARQVVVFAREEAHALRHAYIGTEHILLGLLREDDGVAYAVLTRLGITVERVRARVVEIVSAGEATGDKHDLPLTPRARKVLDLALREALSTGHNSIDTEHILLALVRENEGVAVRILLDEDADAEKIRSLVLAAIGRPRPNQALTVGVAGPPQRLQQFRGPRHLRGRPPGLSWPQATLLWRPEGVELRIPLSLGEASIATFAADGVWAQPPLSGLRREIWSGWLALASPTLLDDVDPVELRGLLDAAAKRAVDRSGRDSGRVEDFLHLLREQPPAES